MTSPFFISSRYSLREVLYLDVDQIVDVHGNPDEVAEDEDGHDGEKDDRLLRSLLRAAASFVTSSWVVSIPYGVTHNTPAASSNLDYRV